MRLSSSAVYTLMAASADTPSEAAKAQSVLWDDVRLQGLAVMSPQCGG